MSYYFYNHFYDWNVNTARGYLKLWRKVTSDLTENEAKEQKLKILRSAQSRLGTRPRKVTMEILSPLFDEQQKLLFSALPRTSNLDLIPPRNYW